MNKTLIKTAILIFSVALCVYGVLHWKHTVVDPPRELEFENAHDQALQSSIEEMEQSSDFESVYNECLYKLRRYEQESLISDDMRIRRTEDLLNAYLPKFMLRCGKAFERSEWDEPDWSHRFMRQRIASIKEMKKSDGSPIIEPSSKFVSQMDGVLKILDKYDAAWAVARQTSFYSIARTKDLVSQANIYKNDSHLKNCSALMSALDELPAQIKASHLHYLDYSARNLSCAGLEYYDNFSQKLSNLYNVKIREYETYYNSTSETAAVRSILLDKQYSYLKTYSEYVMNVFHFDSWDEYVAQNEKVYSYFDKCVGNDGRIDNLKSTQRQALKDQSDFDAARYRYY